MFDMLTPDDWHKLYVVGWTLITFGAIFLLGFVIWLGSLVVETVHDWSTKRRRIRSYRHR